MEFIKNQLNEIAALLTKLNLLEKEFFTLEDAAQYLGQSRSSLYKLTSKRCIPFYVPNGKIIYFRRSELEEWIINSRIETVEDHKANIDNYLSKKGGL